MNGFHYKIISLITVSLLYYFQVSKLLYYTAIWFVVRDHNCFPVCMLIEGVVYNDMNSEKKVEQFSSQVFIYLCEKSQHSSGNIGTLFHCICKTSKAIQSEHMSFHNSLLHDCPQKLVLRMCLASGYVMCVCMFFPPWDLKFLNGFD